LLLKIGDMALGTVLLYRMLESGSPVVLIAIFTVIVVANALTCTVMMFLPYKRTVLPETLVDILCVCSCLELGCCWRL
jgi:flagellar motor component MotA